MHYKRKCLIYALSISAFLPDVAAVSGLQIPFSNSKHIKRDDSTVDVTLPDLGLVKTFVCPSKADLFRRQVNGPQTITIPKDQIETFLLELRMIELQMVAAIDAMLMGGGFISPSDITDPSLPTSIPLSSEMASIPPEPMTTLATSATSTTTITRTTTLVRTRSRVPDVAAPSTAASQDSSIAPTIDPVAAASTTTSVPSNPTTDSTSVITSPWEIKTASPTTIPLQDNTARYTFNAESSNNVAVYFGQSPATGSSSLESQCADPNIDIVILAFIISPRDGGTYPSINFGNACTGQTDMMRTSAPGLLSCPDLASSIVSCQNTHSKKVFLSMGGSTGQISFTSDEEGSAFADVLWQLFGPPGQVDVMMRPFGSVQIDGFDVDNENNNPTGLSALATTLRSHFSTATKPYYLSSAPQCPFPDASNPTALLLQCDFVWVQFYNNPSCEIGSSGFEDSVKQWSKALDQSTMATKPKLYLGLPAWSEAGSSAYGAIGGAKGMEGVVRGVEQMGLGNFGGAMFWDGTEGLLNVEDGKDILSYAKDGLAQSENPS